MQTITVNGIDFDVLYDAARGGWRIVGSKRAGVRAQAAQAGLATTQTTDDQGWIALVLSDPAAYGLEAS